MLLLLLVLPAVLAWDPAEGDVPWQPDEIALFELVSTMAYSVLFTISAHIIVIHFYPSTFRLTLSTEPSTS